MTILSECIDALRAAGCQVVDDRSNGYRVLLPNQHSVFSYWERWRFELLCSVTHAQTEHGCRADG